jgi:hypothetical protein
MKPVRSIKAAQTRTARVLVEQKVGRPMTNKAAKKWIKRRLRAREELVRVQAELRAALREPIPEYNLLRATR